GGYGGHRASGDDRSPDDRPAPGTQVGDERLDAQHAPDDNGDAGEQREDLNPLVGQPDAAARRGRRGAAGVLGELGEGAAGKHEQRPGEQHHERTGTTLLARRRGVAHQADRSGTFADAGAGDREPHGDRRPFPVEHVFEERDQLVAVAFPPGGGIPAQERSQSGALRAHAVTPAVRRRVVATSVIAVRSRTAPASAAAPAAVSRYGRRRSSDGTGSMSPRSSRRVIAP